MDQNLFHPIPRKVTMMRTREDLQDELERMLGNKRVYFQKPSSNKISYPAIVYSLDSGETKFADDRPYLHKKRYQITLLTLDPDDEMIDKITMSVELQRPEFNNHFVSDNIHHYVFNLYY